MIGKDKKMKLTHRVASILACLVMALGLVSAPALAEDITVLNDARGGNAMQKDDGIVAESKTSDELAVLETAGDAGYGAVALGDEEPAIAVAEAAPSVSYGTHVQTYGNQALVTDGAISGTTGEAKRLEAVWLTVGGPVSGGIEYRTHVQTYGWQGWVANGAMSGTTGQAKRLEAIQIRLTGKLAESYDVWYRVHAQKIGWLAWAKNGEEAGTSGLSWRLEALQVVIVPKGETAPGDVAGIQSVATFAFTTVPSVAYHTHVQTYGWMGWVKDGALSGTSGQSKRLEGLVATLDAGQVGGGLRYRAHVQTYGWQNWVNGGSMSGTSGESKRMEAVRIELTGQVANYFDVWYRTHIQTFGWQGWAKNGEASGSEGLGKRLEAIEIRVLPKGVTPGDTSNPFRSFTGSGDAELDGILAHIIATRTGRDANALRRAYDYVTSMIYADGPKSQPGSWQTWSVREAKKMYRDGSGNCFDYAALMTWIARALGYNAQPKTGEVKSSINGVVKWRTHCWCEIVEGGTTFILDCEEQKWLPSRSFYMVTYETAPAYYR